jgi:hypothetical protein
MINMMSEELTTYLYEVDDSDALVLHIFRQPMKFSLLYPPDFREH